MRQDLGNYLKKANFKELRVLTLSKIHFIQPITSSWLKEANK